MLLRTIAAALCLAAAAPMPAQTLMPASVYPADGSRLSYAAGQNLDVFNITFDSDVVLQPGLLPWLTDDRGNRTECSQILTGAAFDMPQTVIIRFNDTAAFRSGTYTLTVPRATAGLPAWQQSGYASGQCNPELTYTYHYTEDPALASQAPDDDGSPLEITQLHLTTGRGSYNLLQPGLQLPGLSGHSVFTIGSNKNQLAEAVYLSITDITEGEELRTYWTYDLQETLDTKTRVYGKNAAGNFVVDTTYDLEFLKGHDYLLTLGFYYQYDGVPEDRRVCYGTASIPFTGTTEPYEYSDARIVGLDPDPEFETLSFFTEQITVSFSQPVELDMQRCGIYAPDGQHMSLYLFPDAEVSADRTQWALRLNPMAPVGGEPQVTIHLCGTDSQGHTLTTAGTPWCYTQGSKQDRVIVIVYDENLTGVGVGATRPDNNPSPLLYDLKGRPAQPGAKGLLLSKGRKTMAK